MAYYNGVETLAKGYLERVQAQAKRVKFGMTRAEVDDLLQNFRGIQGPSITIYHQPGGAKLEVPFSNLGGMFSEQNRVIGETRVFVETAGNRWGIELQK